MTKQLSLLHYVCIAILNTHATDNLSALPGAVIETYNHEIQGRAYYSTPHGGRLRNLPTYKLSGSKDVRDKNYMWKTFYPEVAWEGTTCDVQFFFGQPCPKRLEMICINSRSTISSIN